MLLKLFTLEFGEEPLINGRQLWLAIAYEVRTRIIGLSEDIFIPELSL